MWDFRYLAHPPPSSICLPSRFQSSKSGKIYLHRDIRLLFSRKSMEVDSGAAYELQSFTESPIDPPFSTRCWSPSFSHTSMQAKDSHWAHGCFRRLLKTSDLKMAVNKTQLSGAQELHFFPVCHSELTEGEARHWETRHETLLSVKYIMFDHRGWVKGYRYRECCRSLSPD